MWLLKCCFFIYVISLCSGSNNESPVDFEREEQVDFGTEEESPIASVSATSKLDSSLGLVHDLIELMTYEVPETITKIDDLPDFMAIMRDDERRIAQYKPLDLTSLQNEMIFEILVRCTSGINEQEYLSLKEKSILGFIPKVDSHSLLKLILPTKDNTLVHELFKEHFLDYYARFIIKRDLIPILVNSKILNVYLGYKKSIIRYIKENGIHQVERLFDELKKYHILTIISQHPSLEDDYRRRRRREERPHEYVMDSPRLMVHDIYNGRLMKSIIENNIDFLVSDVGAPLVLNVNHVESIGYIDSIYKFSLDRGATSSFKLSSLTLKSHFLVSTSSAKFPYKFREFRAHFTLDEIKGDISLFMFLQGMCDQIQLIVSEEAVLHEFVRRKDLKKTIQKVTSITINLVELEDVFPRVLSNFPNLVKFATSIHVPKLSKDDHKTGLEEEQVMPRLLDQDMNLKELSLHFDSHEPKSLSLISTNLEFLPNLKKLTLNEISAPLIHRICDTQVTDLVLNLGTIINSDPDEFTESLICSLNVIYVQSESATQCSEFLDFLERIPFAAPPKVLLPREIDISKTRFKGKIFFN